MAEQKKATRRRGGVLEKAILLAAWEELTETGYTNLTMESVAVRAGTNKAVLYRRWANKSELVLAAIRANMPKITNDVPDTGNLRDDVYTYLQTHVEPLRAIGTQAIRGLLMDPVVWRTITASIPIILQRRSEGRTVTPMTAILKNAELRGEIRLEQLTPRIISMPMDLLQHEIINRLEPISDEAIAEIVDDLFIPLVEYRSQKQK